MKLFSLYVLALGLLAVESRAQINVEWVPMDALNATLPATVRVFQGDGTVRRFNRNERVRAFLVRADTTGNLWHMRNVLAQSSTGYETVTAVSSRLGALLAINGGYFGGGQSYSFVAEDGQTLATNLGAVSRSTGTFYPTRGTFGQLRDGSWDVAWIYSLSGVNYTYPNPSPNTRTTPAARPSATFPEGASEWPVLSGMGGGPVLVKDGQKRVTFEEEVFFDSGIGEPDSQDNPRTAIGYTATGELLLLVVDGRQTASFGFTLSELADFFLQLGAVEAVNLDGGGSSAMAVGSTLVNRPEGGTFQRPVAAMTVLMPGPRPKPQEPPPPAFEQIIDTGDAGQYRESGAWFTSANTPFWGSTPSRLHATSATVTARAAFIVGQEVPEGEYEVSAWWVPSTVNRARNTPYTVYHRGEAQGTVRVNQTDATTLNKWNVLGTYRMAAGDSIVVTNDAAGPATPSYVVVDAVRLERKAATSSTPELLPQGALNVFPQPARDRLYVEFPAGSATRVALYDLLGREVYAENVSPQLASTRLDIAGWAPGVYVLVVTGDGAQRTRSVVIH